MSDLTTWLRFIPTDLRVVVPVHFPTTFTRHERMPTVNALDAGIVAHEAADRIDALEECLRELLEKCDTFGGNLRCVRRDDERAAWNKARALLEE